MAIFLQSAIIISGILSFLFLILYKLKEKHVYCMLSLFFSLVILISLLIKLTISCFDLGGKSSRYLRYEREYMELGGKYLGLYLSRIKIDTKSNEILVIDFPEDMKILASGADFSGDVIKGIKDGLKERQSKYSVKTVVKANAKDNSATWFKAAEFDKIMLDNKDTGIVISLVGYPPDFENIRFTEQMESVPKFIFFGGRLSTLDPAIRAKMVLAVLTLVPGKSLGKRKKPDFNNIMAVHHTPTPG